MKGSSEKCQLRLKAMAILVADIKGDFIFNSKLRKLRGLEIDFYFDFDKQFSQLCDKVSHKLSGLVHISSFMNQKYR